MFYFYLANQLENIRQSQVIKTWISSPGTPFRPFYFDWTSITYIIYFNYKSNVKYQNYKKIITLLKKLHREMFHKLI